ncbi:MAG: hypothetical protein QXQ02_07240 [Halobacteria archaeon]
MSRVIAEYLVDEIEGGYLLLNSKNGKEYRVSPSIPLCDCPDFKFRKRECKHLELVKALEDEKSKDKPMTSNSPNLSLDSKEAEIDGDLVEILRTDELDDMMITEQIAGTEPLVYSTINKRDPNKPPNYKLTVRGVTLAAALQGNIWIDYVKFEKVDGKIIAVARATDKKRNIVRFGYCENYNNPEFKITQLASKAQRNAIKALLLPHIEQRVIEQALTAKSVLILK